MSHSTVLLEKAGIALNNGDTDSARRHIHMIKNYQADPSALNILALCHAINNEFALAENLFIKVLGLTHPTETALINLGLAQLHQQKFAAAIDSFKAAIQANPSNYDAMKNLSVVYAQTNDLTNAAHYAEKAQYLRPNDPDILNVLGEYAITNGDVHNAVNYFMRSLALKPLQPYVYAKLSSIFTSIKEYDKAEKILNAGIAELPQNLLLLISIGGFYESRNRLQEALTQYDKALQTDNDSIIALCSKARVMTGMKQYTVAGKLLQDAYHQFPSNADVCAEYCNYLILMKEYEQAYQISRNYLSSIEPDIILSSRLAIAHSTACRLIDKLNEAEDVLKIIVDRPSIPGDVLETVFFSMGDVLDKLKRYNDAFSYYTLANKAIRLQTDIEYYEDVITQIIKTLDRKSLETIGTSDNQSTLPVFIVGMPRSGTSLVEQILSSHPDVYGAGELTDMWTIGNTISGAMNLLDYAKNIVNLNKEALIKFSDNYIEKLITLSNSPHITDKLPHNFMHLGLIQLLFPNAKVIHCKRHPFDTCLSIYFRKFNDNHVYSKNLGEIARFYKKYSELMDHWNRNTSLAIMTAKYEDLVEDQEKVSRRIIEHIELEWADETLKYYETERVIMTPSYHQASRPIYTESVYRWKYYYNHIQPLIDILGEPEFYM